MCGAANFCQLIMVLFLAPLFALALYKISVNQVVSLAPEPRKATVRLLWKFGSALLALLIPVAWWLSPPDPRLAQHKAERRAAMQTEYTQFWNDFAQIGEKLYSARSDSDPAVQQLKDLLQRRHFTSNFKLGPMHDGRRELAFGGLHYYSWANCRSVYRLESSTPESIKHYWYTGSGFSKASVKDERNLYLIKDAKSETSDKDFTVSANRNGGYIDVDIYTNFLVDEYSPGISATEEFAKECLGEEAYYRYLGKIRVHKRDKQTASTKLDKDLEKAFTALLTKEERSDLNSFVTAKPCVVSVPIKQNSKTESSFKTPCALSPYIKLRQI